MSGADKLKENISVTSTLVDDAPLAKDNAKFIGVLYSDVKREYFATEQLYISEAGVMEEAQVLANYLEKMGHRAKIYPGNSDMADTLKADRPDMVFNLVQTVKGRDDLEPTISATLELLEIPYTGTGMLGLSISHNKYFTKKLLEQVGLPVPRYQLFNSSNDPMDGQLKFPLICKLNEIHGSVAIDETSVVEDERQLRAKLRDLMQIYKQPVIVEEFIVGKEITTIILAGTNRKVYAAEKILPEIQGSKYKLASFNYQWMELAKGEYVKHDGGEMLRDYVKSAFDILKMDDYAKFDLRLDESGRYYFIDCNANPAFGPKETDIAIGAITDLYGITFDEVLKRIIDNTQRDSNESNEVQ